MKIKLFFIVFIFYTISSIAQNTTFNNVSIGTDSPAYGIKIKPNFPNLNGAWARGFYVTNETGTQNYISLGSLGNVTNGITSLIRSYIGTDYDNPFITFLPDGNTGIGTVNPLFKLDVNGILNVTSENNGGGLRFNSAVNGFADSRNWFLSTDGYAYGDFVIKSSSTINGTPDQIKLLIKSNGNLGLGTAIPDEKLTVKGKIHAEEVKIDLSVPVPDYVFTSDYKLKTLQEVEAYIKQNSHLPEIPSAKEIEKNGLMLAEMNMSLLKKIEELTLYSIEQNKKINELEQQNKKLIEFEKRFEKLEHILTKKL